MSRDLRQLRLERFAVIVAFGLAGYLSDPL
jgi:hypothetical protein